MRTGVLLEFFAQMVNSDVPVGVTELGLAVDAASAAIEPPRTPTTANPDRAAMIFLCMVQFPLIGVDRTADRIWCDSVQVNRDGSSVFCEAAHSARDRIESKSSPVSKNRAPMCPSIRATSLSGRSGHCFRCSTV